MTRKEQIKILDDKIEANERQYDLDRINTEISAYSSGDLPKYEYLTKKDLGYKPGACEKSKFEYSPLGKVFNDGLIKEDKNIGVLKRLKNIEDNLFESDNNNNKVGIFQIIKDIKDRGIKIDNDDEAIREIREHIQNLRNEGVRVDNFDEMSKEIKNHMQSLKDAGTNLNISNDQVDDLVNKIFKKIDEKDLEKYSFSKDPDIKSFSEKYKNKTIKAYTSDGSNKINIDTEKINEEFFKYINNEISQDEFLSIYTDYINNFF